ncbi:MAG: hypothetical protein KDC54_02370 [Lewinella sp.]|nr:hypothetical protein [Lewinella sp.]
MKSLFHYLLLLGCGLMLSGLQAQNTSQDLHFLARSYGDSIVLRWAPTDYAAWRGAWSGFQLTRRAEGADAIELTTTVPAWALPQWEAALTGKSPDDLDIRYAMIAAQMRFGQTLRTNLGEDPAMASVADLADEQEARYGYAMFSADLSPLAAEGLGLRFVDAAVVPGRSYEYTLHPLSAETGEPDRSRTYTFRVSSQPYAPPPTPPRLHLDAGDHLIRMEADLSLYQGDFTAFLIERATRPEGPFARLTTTPVAILEHEWPALTYTDILADNETIYYYRLIGITAFGEYTTPSEAVRARGRDLTLREAPVLEEVLGEQGGAVRISWRMPEVDDLAGFWVGRAARETGPFNVCHREMLPATARVFEDEHPLPGRNFYHVIAVDEAGNMRVSHVRFAAMVDDEPPPTPTNLRGRADSTGWVLLRWDSLAVPDLLGFRLYYANDTTHEFSVLTGRPALQNYFVDSISTRVLNAHIYYRVTALDRNYNESAPSPILTVERFHDFQLPAPLITDIAMNEEGVTLFWTPSSHPLVTGYRVYAREEDQSDWRLVETLEDATIGRHTVDLPAGRYVFSLKAFSSQARESDYTLGIRAHVRALRPPGVEGLSGQAGTEGVRLSWNASGLGVSHLVVYRSVDEGPVQPLGRVNMDQTAFQDREATIPGAYRYWIRAFGADGRASVFGEPVEVRVR